MFIHERQKRVVVDSSAMVGAYWKEKQQGSSDLPNKTYIIDECKLPLRLKQALYFLQIVSI